MSCVTVGCMDCSPESFPPAISSTVLQLGSLLLSITLWRIVCDDHHLITIKLFHDLSSVWSTGLATAAGFCCTISVDL